MVPFVHKPSHERRNKELLPNGWWVKLPRTGVWRWLDIGGGGPVMPATVNDPIPGLQLAAWRGKAIKVRRVYPAVEAENAD